MAKKKRHFESGVLLVDKPGGMTSHDVVGAVRRAFGQREVGHTGTLDPMATGLMVVLLGRATRLARFVEATQKAYLGTVTLGRATTTFDAEGETVEEAEVPALTADQIEGALGSLRGQVEQQVPMFSAVKVGGERLYQKARKGEQVETPKRTITIHHLEARRIGLPDLEIEVVCSKGTYIRTLAVQIGAALGVPAHLSMLRRTQVGRFSVDQAVALADLEGSADRLAPIQTAVAHLPTLTVEGRVAAGVRNGRPLTVSDVQGLAEAHQLEAGAPFAVIDSGKTLLAVGTLQAPWRDLATAAGSDRGAGYACVLPAGPGGAGG